MTMTQTLPPADASTGPGSTGTGWPAPAAGDHWGPRASDPWGAPPAPPLPPADPTPQPRPRRRPGWGALVLATLGAAVLASGATAGTVTLLEDDAPPAAVEEQASPPVAAGADGVDWTTVADAVSPSVVSIRVASASGQGQGSGVVLDEQGHVLTNNHVVTGAGDGARIQIVLADGRVFGDVEVVGLDPSTDLAVLRIVDPPSDLAPARLGDSDSVVAGQPVMAVGNPLGLSDSVTTGIVSAVNRPVTTSASQSQPDPFSGGGSAAEPVVTNAIQTDAAVNPGNSGGALVDASGAVVGIPSSIASTATGSGQAGSIGLGFAIPVNEAERIADELVADGSADHAWLGVSLQDGAGTADGTTRQGAEVVEVTAGTPAAEAGLQAGDVVVAVDDENVSGSESLTAQVRERAPGAEVTLHVVRGSELVQVEAVLGTRAGD
jgi:putative serine protease PepD